MSELAVIFDLDGTLIDSAPDIHAAVNLSLRDIGYPDLPFAQARSFIGHGAPTLMAQVAAATGAAPPQQGMLLQGFLRHYDTGATSLTRLYPGVLDALTALQAAGHPMAICTNKPLSATMAVLQAYDLQRFFPVVLGGDSLAQRKPHPAPLLAAWSQLATPKAVFVGDSEVDADTALAAALPFLLFTQGYRKTDIAQIPHRAAFADHTALLDLITALSENRH
ncbi:MAG: phosphoglycolate phosphatase [Candidatus Saccharibacteria bacterium]|nr:phosphoglycolate phosphatase [Pseudorhodobacter sp.]